MSSKQSSSSITSEEIDEFLNMLNAESRQPTTSTKKSSSSKKRKLDEKMVNCKPNPFLKPKFGEKPKLARQLAMVENIPLPGQLEKIDQNEKGLFYIFFNF